MGWEKRGNRYYYYRKERIGSKVVSDYVGGGSMAQLISSLDNIERITHLVEKAAVDDEIANDRKIYQAFQEIEEKARAIIHAEYLINGFYLHNGQWRKARKVARK